MGKIFDTAKKRYYNFPINLKLNFVNILIIVIPTIFLAYFINIISSSAIVDKSSQQIIQNFHIISRGIDSLMNQVEYISALTSNNESIQRIMNVPEKDILTSIEMKSDAVNVLDTIVVGGNLFSEAFILGKNNFLIHSSNINNTKLNTYIAKNNNNLDRAYEEKGRPLWLNTSPVNFHMFYENLNCISMLRSLVDRNSGLANGILKVDINQKIFSNLFNSELGYGFADTIIVDNKGTIICAVNEDRLYSNIYSQNYFEWILENNNDSKIFSVDGKKFLITTLYYQRTDWHIIGITPIDVLTEDSNKVTILIYFVGLICIVVATIASLLNSRLITKPIISLSKTMNNAGQGDMEVRAIPFGDDELGGLAKSFNSMMDKMSNLMEKIYIEQMKKKEFELLALQSQMNPHFLYNTLESICSLAIKKDNPGVVLMVKSLAQFYRMALSKGRNVISIKDEMEITKNYLIILKIRYRDKFDYSINIDESILSNSIVKLSIQPIVENAIYHGIRQKRGKGTINIIGKMIGDNACISIIDNGNGFDSKKILSNSDIVNNNNYNKNNNQNGYGLKNVSERIKLYFGDAYGIEINSVLGEGTKVDIILPLVTYEE